MTVLDTTRSLLNRLFDSSKGRGIGPERADWSQPGLFETSFSAEPDAPEYDGAMSGDNGDARLQGLLMIIGTMKTFRDRRGSPSEETWAPADLLKVERNLLRLVSGESLQDPPPGPNPRIVSAALRVVTGIRAPFRRVPSGCRCRLVPVH
jgi:hypothetical protein